MAPMKTHSSEIGSGEEIIPDIPNEMDDILIDKQTANTEANIQNAETNKVINPSFDVQNTEQTLNTELDKEIVVYINDVPFSHDKQRAFGI